MPTRSKRLLPPLNSCQKEMREPAVAYLFEQAEKFRALKEMIAEGMEDVASGHVSEGNFIDFLRQARGVSQGRNS